MAAADFSFKSRERAIARFESESFDLLVIGGGITGAATARDAVSRGLKVALVERRDFAFGTSSRSSKLIHGGLRYLENFELGLVFESLAERALLLKTVPHMVRPLPFFLPVYAGDSNGRVKLDLGLWLYDLLALFRTPGFHQRLSRKAMLSRIPFLKAEGLVGGFRYFDASMWDDVLAVETARSAQVGGAAIANYVEAVAPIWNGDRIEGFRVRDLADPGGREIELRAARTVVCAGPWTDEIGGRISAKWRRWLSPSKGVHLILDLKRIPVPGAMVMSHPEDGRIAFVIARPDMGPGIVIVGTTDGPTPDDPEKATIEPSDVDYLMDLLQKYFPTLGLSRADILSAYVGVRPLMGPMTDLTGSEGQDALSTATGLQKVSREHHIDVGPGGAVFVAGGKYTTHRKMAEEIVDFTLDAWNRDAKKGKAHAPSLPRIGKSRTKTPVNPQVTDAAISPARKRADAAGYDIPEELWGRYGADALGIFEGARKRAAGGPADPEGFPLLAEQLRYTMRSEMVLKLEDFYLRRVPLYAARRDHGLPWADELAKVWAEELGKGADDAKRELESLRRELEARSSWAR